MAQRGCHRSRYKEAAASQGVQPGTVSPARANSTNIECSPETASVTISTKENARFGQTLIARLPHHLCEQRFYLQYSPASLLCRPASPHPPTQPSLTVFPGASPSTFRWRPRKQTSGDAPLRERRKSDRPWPHWTWKTMDAKTSDWMTRDARFLPLPGR